MVDYEKKALEAIGRVSTLTYPGTEGKIKGIIEDRVAFGKGVGFVGGREYVGVVDLIDYEGEKSIRFGYYRVLMMVSSIGAVKLHTLPASTV